MILEPVSLDRPRRLADAGEAGWRMLGGGDLPFRSVVMAPLTTPEGEQAALACLDAGRATFNAGDSALLNQLAAFPRQALAAQSFLAAREAAEESNRLKSQFLAMMSHELRTPLNGVLGMASMLDTTLTDPNQRKMLAIIMDSGRLLLNIIDDILDLSKIEAGKLAIMPAPFSPARLARTIEGIYTVKAMEKNISFAVRLGPGAERARNGDEARIAQILHNLIGNAVKFTETGEVAVTVGDDADGRLSIEVRDTGIGMTSGQLAGIFEPFAQADGTTTRRFGGTGLGMSIVKRLVEAMQGEVSVESREGEGTCVRISLPIETIETQPDAPAPERELGADGPLDLRVLAAEDNMINQMVLSAMLSRIGVRVTMVDDGEAAVQAWAPGAYDMLLFDISMPVMDGPAALSAIRAREAAAGSPRTPAIAVTANVLAHQVDDYMCAGFDGHVAKPIDPAKLESTMRALQRRSQP